MGGEKNINKLSVDWGNPLLNISRNVLTLLPNATLSIRNLFSSVPLFYTTYTDIITAVERFQYICFLGLLASVTDGSWPCVVS